MQYNTKRKQLIVPEFGRNIQMMVDYCLTIPDKKLRFLCAQEIVNVMKRFFPHLCEGDKELATLWNKLAEMSDFKLDIDYPVKIVTKNDLQKKPERIPYPEKDIIYFHYGHIIQELINYCITLDESPERKDLELMIANRMKLSYKTWNKSVVSDDKILRDLFELSAEQIDLTKDPSIKLVGVSETQQRQKVSARNKKKK